VRWHWDAWARTVIKYALAGLKEGQLKAPVEVLVTSVTDDPVFHIRFTAFEHDAHEILQFLDESNLQGREILPVTVTITDGTGKQEMWEVDPRSQSIN
jgi:hypothetical protein